MILVRSQKTKLTPLSMDVQDVLYNVNHISIKQFTKSIALSLCHT